MANLDNVSKRGSSINFILPWKRSLPIPDGTINQGDRQHTAGAYSGILAAVSAVITDWYNLIEQQLIYTLQSHAWLGTTGTNVVTLESRLRSGPRSFYDHELPAIAIKVLGKPRQRSAAIGEYSKFYRWIAQVLHRGGDLDAIVDAVQEIMSNLEDALEIQYSSDDNLTGLGTHSQLQDGPVVEITNSRIDYGSEVEASFTVMATVEGTVEIVTT